MATHRPRVETNDAKRDGVTSVFDFLADAPASADAAFAMYAQEPWDHALDVVPALAMLQKTGSPGAWPDAPVDEAVESHLMRSLRHWSAFRAGGDHDDQRRRLSKALPALVAAMHRVIPHGRLSLADLNASEAHMFASKLEKVVLQLGQEVKNNDSYVLPSKVAHLLFPAWVPAFDLQVIRDEVLAMIESGTRHRQWYHMYVLLSWWLLQSQNPAMLSRLRGRASEVLLSDPALQALDIDTPSPTDVQDGRIDTYVSEYVLIGMSRSTPAPVIRCFGPCCG